VSHTSRENLIIRAAIDPSIVHAIPNAIDSSKFTPNLSKRSIDRIKVVVISRLVYRKGVDLLAGVIPQVCNRFSNVDFIIGGDGAKKRALEKLVEHHRLQDRVKFLGAVPHTSVRDVLVQGHIFLNCSLTESFCIAILEAASCGLFVVATDVGGVHEVLPDDMIQLSEPSASSLSENLSLIVLQLFNAGVESKFKKPFDPLGAHKRIEKMYCWEKVAKRTISVYEEVLAKPRLSLLERLQRYRSIGNFAGFVAMGLGLYCHFIIKLIERWQPQEIIDVVPDLIDPIAGVKEKHVKTSPRNHQDISQTGN